MKYAIASVGGKQTKLEEGKIYQFDRFDGKIDQILFYRDAETIRVGAPLVEGAVVATTKIADKRDKKVEVRRYRAKSRYRRNKGHRQPITLVRVDKISLKA